MPSIKIHAFEVECSDDSEALEDVLEAIADEEDPEAKIREVGLGIDVRCEDIVQRDGFWLLDFVRFRSDHGPGKVGVDTEIEGFDFDEGESFGEETAALYDPTSGFILIQYNHFGVRYGPISEYLSLFNEDEDNDYTFKPKFDQEIERRFQQQGITRKLEFGINATRMNATDRAVGRSLEQALAFGRAPGSDRIKVTLGVGPRDASLNRRFVRNIVRDLRRMIGADERTVTTLRVTGKENHDAETEVLDLLGHRLTFESEINPDEHLQFPRNDRYRALRSARTHWRDLL
ncbi:MAG: hypothetical protein HUJ31_15810 [Pseudomonadales bacterium]|nr:hypothetical protein [Pseudomonadales bacterium]